MSFDRLKINQRSYCELPYSGFWGWLSKESQPQNPAFMNNPENFHPCIKILALIECPEELEVSLHVCACFPEPLLLDNAKLTICLQMATFVICW